MTRARERRYSRMSLYLSRFYLGIPRSRFTSFEDARKFAWGLGLSKKTEWDVFVKSGEKPINIPARPDTVYRGSGFSGFGDFLGYNRALRGWLQRSRLSAPLDINESKRKNSFLLEDFLKMSGLSTNPELGIFVPPKRVRASFFFRLRTPHSLASGDMQTPVWVPATLTGGQAGTEKLRILSTQDGERRRVFTYQAEQDTDHPVSTSDSRRCIRIRDMERPSFQRQLAQCLGDWYSDIEPKSILDLCAAHTRRPADRTIVQVLSEMNLRIYSPLGLSVSFPAYFERGCSLLLGDTKIRCLQRLTCRRGPRYSVMEAQLARPGHPPLRLEEAPDITIVAVKPGSSLEMRGEGGRPENAVILEGVFFFPKSLLHHKGVFTSPASLGRFSFYVYAPHVSARTSDARRAQQWQAPYYIDFTRQTPEEYLPKVREILNGRIYDESETTTD